MDEQTRQLERQYRKSRDISDLTLWLHELVRQGQLNWWEAVDAIRIHYYGNTLPALLREEPLDKVSIRIFRVSGSVETRPDGYYSANTQLRRDDIQGARNMQSEIGLAEIIPKAYFLWGLLVFNFLTPSITALNISPTWPLFQTFALQNYLPIAIVSLDDSRIMDRNISAKHLNELFEYFGAIRMPRLMQE